MSDHDHATPRSGLMAGDVPIPLLGVSVEAEVKDFLARVTVSQRYRNDEPDPIEAVYVFPLDEAAAVCGFEALIDDVHVVGRVMDREEAFRNYDDAIAEGHGAFLLDQETPDVFTASIGNVAPGREVIIRITYVTELGLEGEDRCFVLPSTVSPRYAPESDRTGVGPTPEERLNPPVAFDVPYGLDLVVRLAMPTAIRGIESVAHPVSMEMDGSRAVVRLATEHAPLDADFVLRIRIAEPGEPRGWIEVDDRGRRAALLSFRPVFEAEPVPGEFIFLVDRSGSMQGTSIHEARNALQLCLRSLPEGSRFNIVGFGSTVDPFFPESRAYDNESLKDAASRLAELDADLGGTEILAPLKWILGKPVDRSRPRQLLVLTDGEVTNTDEVIDLIRKHRADIRLFAFGIGHGASRHLVRGMARAGSGAAEFIAPGERVEPKVLRQMRRAVAPALADVKIDWKGGKVTQAPFQPPPLFSDDRLLVYGLLNGRSPGRVILTASGPGGPVRFEINLGDEVASPGRLIGTLAARSLIRDLEEGASALHDRQGSRQKRGRKDPVREEIVRLGLEWGLASRETSFVAVEKRDVPVHGEMKLRQVPIRLTRGWGDLDGSGRGMVTGAVMQCLAGPTRLSGIDAALLPYLKLAGGQLPRHRARSAGDSPASPRAADAAAEVTSGHLRLASLQNADGTWSLDEPLARFLGVTLEALESPLGGKSSEESRRAWATALALAWLEDNAAADRDEWLLLAAKARHWLAHTAAAPPAGTWLEAARSFQAGAGGR